MVACHIETMYSQAKGAPVDEPLPTVTAGANHHGLVTTFLKKYLGGDAENIVRIGDETYRIVDIGLRMLTPRELARAQGFPDGYILTGTKEQQVARVGNSVSPPVARAIVEANRP